MIKLFKFKLNKYRIVEEDNKFYPEERFLFLFWSRYSKLDTRNLWSIDIYFDTFEEAKEFIITRINLDKVSKRTKIIHNIN